MKLLSRIFPSKFNRRRLHLLHGMDARLNTELSALRSAEASASAVAGTLDAVRATMPIHTTRKPLSRKRLLPKITLGSALATGCIFGIYWLYIERTPSYTPPPEASLVLNPNAYGTYLGLAETVDLDNISHLRQFDAKGEWDKDQTPRAGEDKIPDNDTNQKRLAMNSILKRNRRELQTLRHILDSKYSALYQWDNLPASPIPPQFKKLYSLLLLDALAAQERKDAVQTANAALDALQFAVQLQGDADLGGKLSLMLWEAPARNFLWDVLPKLDAGTLEKVSRRMDRIINLSEQASVDKALVNEQIRGQKYLLELFSTPNWRWKQVAEYGLLERWRHHSVWLDYASLLRWSKQDIFRNYNAAMGEQIELSKKPYALSKALLKISVAVDPVGEMQVPFTGHVIFYDTISRTENALLRATMAIEEYRLLTGSYCDTGIPNWYKYKGKVYTFSDQSDPFAADAKHLPGLRFKRTQWGYLLYSIGPDGKDDGGTLSINPLTYRRPYKASDVYPESKGDIVAGFNRM